MSELLRRARQWWFNSESDDFDSYSFGVDRGMVHRHGGPSPDFSACETCQESEWLSRIAQTNLYHPHKCKTSRECARRCRCQGYDTWVNYHQDHFFAATGVDKSLNAPKGALLLHESPNQHKWFWERSCNAGMATFRQRIAWTCQVDTEVRGSTKNWSEYDFCWMVNKGKIELFDRPPIPMILYCHDAWRGNKQAVLDHFKPAVILTPFPTMWRNNMQIPEGSEVVFAPAVVSPFFDRLNVDGPKTWDLLVIGALGSHFYEPRRALNEQLKSLPAKYTVEHSHAAGAKRARWMGPMDGDDHCYMSKWMQKLGQARFVTFGPCAGAASEMMLIKYFECLASGAIPILPEVQDMKVLGLESMVHYIPLALVWENPQALSFFLDRYEHFRYIAENAVAWHQKNAERLIFDIFENTVRRLTSERYPARMI